LGLIVTALMAEMRSCRSQVSRIGVWPRGVRVRRTVGVNMNPLSSRKTKWASGWTLGDPVPIEARIEPAPG
jgi:hypothetical protein